MRHRRACWPLETVALSVALSVALDGDDLGIVVDPAQREAIVIQLDAKMEIERRDGQ